MATSSTRELALGMLHRAGLLVPARNLYNTLRYVLNFRLIAENNAYRNRGTPDGLPVPTPKLMHLVSGNFGLEGLYRNGEHGARCIRRILEKNGIRMEDFGALLDFGCGCGRVFRFWKDLAGVERHGCDYNPELVRWCRKNLLFGRFEVNGLAGGLPYPDSKFDFIYAISVFTHLPVDLQRFWFDELHRVTRKGGHLYITVLGTKNQDKLSPAQKEEFRSGRLIVEKPAYPGTNICRVFHPERYFREELARGVTVVDFIPGGAEDAEGQDVFLVRK